MSKGNDVNGYMRKWRETPQGQSALLVQKRRDKARRLAYRALARRHTAEFNETFVRYLRELEEGDQNEPGE